MVMMRFGVMFAQIEGLSDLKEQVGESVFNEFLKDLASKITSTIRPTDTIAWSPDGYLLILIDAVSSNEAALILASRVDHWLTTYLEKSPFSGDLGVKTGVLICDSDYENADVILDDLNFSRTQITYDEEIKKRLYYRESLQDLRNK